MQGRLWERRVQLFSCSFSSQKLWAPIAFYLFLQKKANENQIKFDNRTFTGNNALKLPFSLKADSFTQESTNLLLHESDGIFVKQNKTKKAKGPFLGLKLQVIILSE